MGKTDGLQGHGVDQVFPLGVSAHGAGGYVGVVFEHTDGGGARDFLQHLLALVHAGDHVQVVAHHPGGLDVARGGDEVGQVHQSLATPLDHHVLEAFDVAWRRANRNAGQKLGGAINGVEDTGRLQWLPGWKMRIWSVDEVLWFDSDNVVTGAGHDAGDLREAIAGRAIAMLEFPDDHGGGEASISHPYIEIYAPIYGPASSEITAIGEIYQDARQLLAERAQFERRVWGAVGLATLGFIAVMFVLARQHRQLALHLDHERVIASQNKQLHEAAETAWRTSGQTHEALLNHLGAELHDGPVQLLSLLALMDQPVPSGAKGAKPSVQGIAQDVLDDLRRISAGLILPELGQLSVRDTVMLAITRHANATGTDVSHDFGVLPESLDDLRKTCLYRIVQEGLNNAFRHGGGYGQRVTAKIEDRALHVAVVNEGSGPSESPAATPPARNTGLGVIGLRNRLRVFGGTLDATEADGGGFYLEARLPLA